MTNAWLVLKKTLGNGAWSFPYAAAVMWNDLCDDGLMIQLLVAVIEILKLSLIILQALKENANALVG